MPEQEWGEWLQLPPTRELLRILASHGNQLHGDFRKCGSWDDHLKLDGRISGIEEVIDLIKGLGKDG